MRTRAAKLTDLRCCLFALLLLAGCHVRPKPELEQPETAIPPGPRFLVMQPDQVPLFEDLFPKEGLYLALENQLNWLETSGSDKVWTFGDLRYNASDMALGLRRFRQLWSHFVDRPHELREALLLEFLLLKVQFPAQDGVLFTGYYAPIFAGSLTESENYRFPLYARPDDLVVIRPSLFSPKFLVPGDALKDDRLFARYDAQSKAILPYYSREEIDGKSLLPAKDRLVFLHSYIDQFLFHVQGGGFVKLEQGGYLKLNYAAKNGHHYRSLGKLLIEDGKLPANNLTLKKVTDYLEQHPEQLEHYCFQNPSYVFYQRDPQILAEIAPENYPNGSLNFPVTPKRSIATDKRYFPGGMLCYLKGKQDLSALTNQPLRGFVLDQDTGGAIVGAHIDFFVGAGKEAGQLAGNINDPEGELYILLPKRVP